MFSFKIVAVVLLATTLQTQSSVVHQQLPVPVAPALRYTLVAPQNVRPFAAQVSTFTKGLNIYAAPYAAGVLGGPAIIPRNFLPSASVPAPLPAAYPAGAIAAPYYPGQVPVQAPSPYYPGTVPAVAASPYYPEQAPAFASYPYIPGQVPALASSPYLPAPVAPAPIAGVAPAHLLPAPFARSVHAVSPAVGPAVAPHLSAAPLLG
ncbi:unnamed protein product [Phaedon cochleariae]|uniref:Uncharacterized protein n=1 Tax=Phaedon cochleariae TaxID=80249 RepID=A0A9P0GUF2_PHACE|nr:unnamed protein product [Phaedon cochleariae]